MNVAPVYYDSTKSPYDYASILTLGKKVVSILYNLLNGQVQITDFNTASNLLSIID